MWGGASREADGGRYTHTAKSVRDKMGKAEENVTAVVRNTEGILQPDSLLPLKFSLSYFIQLSSLLIPPLPHCPPILLILLCFTSKCLVLIYRCLVQPHPSVFNGHWLSSVLLSNTNWLAVLLLISIRCRISKEQTAELLDTEIIKNSQQREHWTMISIHSGV